MNTGLFFVKIAFLYYLREAGASAKLWRLLLRKRSPINSIFNLGVKMIKKYVIIGEIND